MKLIHQHRAALKINEKEKGDTVKIVVAPKPELSDMAKRIQARNATRVMASGQADVQQTTVVTTVKDLEYYQTIASAYLDKMADLEDIEERLPVKAEGVIKLKDFVTDYVNKAANYPNSVAVTLLIWLIDLADIATATPLALHLIKQGIHKTPANFKSELPTFVCDSFYDWASAKHKKNQAVGPYFHNIVQAMVNDGWDVSDLVRGKMFAMLGKHYELAGQETEAVEMYQSALRENDAAGVKTRLADLVKKLGLTS